MGFKPFFPNIALSCAQPASARALDVAATRSMLAKVVAMSGEPEKALVPLMEAITIYPKHPALYSARVVASQANLELNKPQVAADLLDDIVTVDNDEICAAVQDVYEDTRAIAEPAGVLAIAGLKKFFLERPGCEGHAAAHPTLTVPGPGVGDGTLSGRWLAAR